MLEGKTHLPPGGEGEADFNVLAIRCADRREEHAYHNSVRYLEGHSRPILNFDESHGREVKI